MQQDTGVHNALYADVGWTCTNCADVKLDAKNSSQT